MKLLQILNMMDMIHKSFDKETGSAETSKKISNLNEVLAQEIHKPMIRKTQETDRVCEV